MPGHGAVHGGKQVNVAIKPARDAVGPSDKLTIRFAATDDAGKPARAELAGDHYVVSGTKTWTTHGNYAKYMILLARSIPDARNKYAGLSFFLAPMKVPGAGAPCCAPAGIAVINAPMG